MARKNKDEMPAQIATVLQDWGVYVPANASRDVKDVLALGTAGRCMTCGGDLKSKTMLVVNELGVVTAHCGGACMQDMIVTQWMQSEHDDIVDGIKFRGSGGAADDGDEDGYTVEDIVDGVATDEEDVDDRDD